MPRDGRVGGIRQADFLQADAPLPLRHVLARRRREESHRQHLLDLFALQLRFDRAADQARALAENRDRLFVGLRFRDRAAFPWPARQLFQSACSWKPSIFVPFAARSPATRVGQREIDVVAAEQDVFADGDALELQFAVAASVTAISVKSVVPPPISTTRIRSPLLTRSRQSGCRSIQA